MSETRTEWRLNERGEMVLAVTTPLPAPLRKVDPEWLVRFIEAELWTELQRRGDLFGTTSYLPPEGT